MDYYINWGLCNLPTFILPDTHASRCRCLANAKNRWTRTSHLR